MRSLKACSANTLGLRLEELNRESDKEAAVIQADEQEPSDTLSTYWKPVLVQSLDMFPEDCWQGARNGP